MLVRNSIEINAPLKQVYALAKGIHEHPEFIPDVRSIRIVTASEDGSRIISNWVATIKEFRTLFRWTAESIWDDQSNTCKFLLAKNGPYTFSGQWALHDLGSSTRFDSDIEIDCDLPKVGKHIKYLAARKLKENMESMLANIKAKVEN
jgi:ribosome-associated toxin RatA of RatAB toxin-antitoxin module